MTFLSFYVKHIIFQNNELSITHIIFFLNMQKFGYNNKLLSFCEIMIISIGLKEWIILKMTIYCESFPYISKLDVPFKKKVP